MSFKYKQMDLFMLPTNFNNQLASDLVYFVDMMMMVVALL